MKALAEKGLLSCVKEIIGISSGSLFSLMWVLGYSLTDIERLALEFDFGVLRNIEPEAVLEFPFTFGLDTGEKLEKLILSILRQKGFGADTTFAELSRKCAVGLRCFATELQTSRVREFSMGATPHAKVCMALRASMSLPFLFTPVKEVDSEILLVDGGLLHNLPMAFLDEEEICETWGVIFMGKGEGTGKGKPEPLTDIMQMMKYLYDGCTLMRNKTFVEKYKERVICIPTHENSAYNFEQTREIRQELIEISYKATVEFLFTGIKYGRRFSAS
jgi:NTE family protein